MIFLSTELHAKKLTSEARRFVKKQQNWNAASFKTGSDDENAR